MSEEKKKHFILVHGVCHGAWCWYKVKPLLEASGHRVTVLDQAACGIDTTRSITEITTFEQYAEPLIKLMTSLPSDEKVVIVGHSFGGMSISLAMEKFPDKISVSVFVAAFMPDTKHEPSFVISEYARDMPKETWIDTTFEPYGSDNSEVKITFGTEFMKHCLYELSPIEDLELGYLVKRPGSMFVSALSKMKNFSEEGYGSVPRAYIVCKADKSVPEEHQQRMIDNYPAHLVTEMEETDHMPMFCKPQLLTKQLLEIAEKFA